MSLPAGTAGQAACAPDSTRVVESRPSHKRNQCQHESGPEARHGSAGARRASGVWGGHFGAPTFNRSVQSRSQGVEGFRGAGVVGGGAHGGLELVQRLAPFALLEVDPAEIHERKLTRLVARSALGLLEPGNRLVELV